jgi:hypothetical protein
VPTLTLAGVVSAGFARPGAARVGGVDPVLAAADTFPRRWLVLARPQVVAELDGEAVGEGRLAADPGAEAASGMAGAYPDVLAVGGCDLLAALLARVGEWVTLTIRSPE